MIQIDKDVPMPDEFSEYPFAGMEVGDSFFVPGIQPEQLLILSGSWKKHFGSTFKFQTEAEGNGARIWRRR